MDNELKEVLETIREENAAAHAETQRRFETLEAKFETAEVKNDDAHAETRRLFETAEARNATAHAETRRRLERLDTKLATAQAENEAAHAQTRHQFDLMAEFQQHKLDLVIERVLGNGEKIDQLDAKVDRLFSDHEARITRLEVATSLQGRV